MRKFHSSSQAKASFSFDNTQHTPKTIRRECKHLSTPKEIFRLLLRTVSIQREGKEGEEEDDKRVTVGKVFLSELEQRRNLFLSFFIFGSLHDSDKKKTLFGYVRRNELR